MMTFFVIHILHGMIVDSTFRLFGYEYIALQGIIFEILNKTKLQLRRFLLWCW